MKERDMKEKLSKLIFDAYCQCEWGDRFCDIIADYLLANGVIVPPVKVGDTMWVLSKDLSTIQSVVITDIYCRWHNMGVSISLVTDNPFAYLFCDYEIGIKIFFTEEEAKRALEETNKK